MTVTINPKARETIWFVFMDMVVRLGELGGDDAGWQRGRDGDDGQEGPASKGDDHAEGERDDLVSSHGRCLFFRGH